MDLIKKIITNRYLPALLAAGGITAAQKGATTGDDTADTIVQVVMALIALWRLIKGTK